MVAVGDFGIPEREQMVRLAIWHGWIIKAERQAQSNGVADPVVVLTAIDALNVLRFRFDRSPRNRAVEEIIADQHACITLYRDGKPVKCMQGVVAGDLIDAIAEGLGVPWPADARRGYSGGRFDLAAAIVKHLRIE